MRVLVLCDDYWHPAQVVHDGLKELAAQSFAFVWIEDGRAWTPELMAEFPVVVLSKSNNVSQKDQQPWVTPEVEQAFVAYVRRGGGLLATHSGTVYKDNPTMRALLGGVFERHPEQCLVTVTPKAGAALAQGFSPFTAKDEHYHMLMDDNSVDVFLTTTSDHGSQPGGWTRSEGQGRVCVLTPGHNLEVWQDAAYQTLLCNALRWVGKE